MTTYYKPITNYSYDGPALLSVLNTAIKGCASEHISGCHIITNETYIQTISDILGEIFEDFSIHSVLFFRFSPGLASTVHKDVQSDFAAGENLFAKMALNLPLQNADKVIMKWYTAKEDAHAIPNYTPQTPRLPGEQARPDPNPTSYIKLMHSVRLNKSDINECVENTYYTNPIIVSINNWHSVTNESTETASFVSIRFSENITLEKLMSKFGPA